MSAVIETVPTDDLFALKRTFDAPREKVFKAWTNAAELAKWWGPAGMKVEVVKLDLKPGGVFHYSMTLPDGKKMYGKFIYREIVAPEKLVFVTSFSDENCGSTRHPFAPDWPLETLSTIELTEQNGKTTLTMTGVPINATELERKTFEAGHASMQQGWKGTLDQLDAFVKGQ